MRTSTIDEFVTQTQEKACVIQSLSQMLYNQINDHCTYQDLPDNMKEHMLALADSIGMLAKDINLDGVMI